MKNQHNTFDIIISGGGLSGSLMALSLADLKKSDGSLLSIAIVEATEIEVTKPTTSTATLDHNNVDHNNTKTLFDNRVLALSHGSASYLKKLDVWRHLVNDACAIETIDISDRGYYGKARIEAKEHGVSALGYVIEMAHIGQALLTALAHKSNVHWFSPDCIEDIHWQPSQQDVEESNTAQTGSNLNETVAVTLGSKQRLYAQLLIACDGANSPCRQLAGIDCRQSDYQQMALITNVATQKPHNNKAFERFTEYGPLAMLPQSPLRAEPNGDSRSSLVWTMSPEQGQALMALNNKAFAQQLELAFGSWLGAITQVGKRDIYPLVLVQAEQQTYHRMALIGNASHTIHPIAGQGFNLGLRDVQQLSSLITHVLKEQRDIGSFALLNKYGQKRQHDQNQIINLTDSLVTLFANDLPPLVAGRNIGLKVMNYVTPLKKILVTKLMGY